MSKVPALPKNESQRLARLRGLMVLDSTPEPIFDEITKLASEICGTPISLISLVDEHRQWFKSNVGLEGAEETPRDVAFCAHAILEKKVFEVQDATQDERFSDNPLVTTDPNIRFYAGAPIEVSGFNIGTLCVINREPGELNHYQKTMLTHLASITSKALLMRENAIREIETTSAKLATIIEDSADAILTKSLEGIVTSWNTSAEKMFGYSAIEIIGRPITVLFPLDKLGEEFEFTRKLQRGETIRQFETVRKHKNGRLLHVSISLSPIRDLGGKVVGVSAILRDVTKEYKLKKALASEHERLRVTMDSIGDAVITTDPNGIVKYLNPIAEKLTGWISEEAIGQPLQQVFNIVNDATGEPCVNPVELCLSENRTVGLASHTKLISRDGVEYGIEDSAAPIRDANGTTLGVVLVFHDVTMQREMANEISYRATHDTLTGLLNRSEFEYRFKQFITYQRDQEVSNALMYIDLDQFKVVNDTCGHTAGDMLLKDIAKIMRSAIRGSDTLARIGGDEFAIILEKCGADKAMQIARNICHLVHEYRFYHGEQRFRVGASIGLVMIDSQWRDHTSLLQAADNACYAAKRGGRNRVHMYYDEDRSVEAHRGEIYWVGRIEQALEENGFVLFCQRIMPLNHTGHEHAEILIRMKDKSGELIPPNSFLPAAERFHMVSRIDRWVIKEILTWMEINADAIGHIESLSVNLSGQSVGDPAFHDYVLNLISSVDVDFSKLCFEVTETAAITNIVDAKKFIEAMHRYGVKFSLDDFGSGVSSFGYLQNLSVDFLKIDGQFISDLIQNKIGQATVRCITEVAKATDKRTIAEWVDNQEVESMLKNMGVDFVQGFFKHRPAPLEYILQQECQYDPVT